MADHRLSARQRRFLDALLVAPTVRQAAKDAKIGERTAYRFMTLPAVVNEWNRLKLDAGSLALALAQREAVRSTQALVTIRDDPKAPANARVNAAVRLLEMSNEATLAEQTSAAEEARVARMEAVCAEIKGMEREEKPALPYRVYTADDQSQR